MGSNAQSSLYIGLISGTSMDAVDCALVDFQNDQPILIDFINEEIPDELKSQILSLCEDGENQVQILGETDIKLGKLFSKAVANILQKNQFSKDDIIAIGSHGQTIRHQPPSSSNSVSFTIQLADPNTIAARTNIDTVADFRRKDMAIGGQGAPLVPAFHREFFLSKTSDRVILNIGGMSNITLLEKNEGSILGFDTGPGNVLLDNWIRKNKQRPYDSNGDWAATGKSNDVFLESLLKDAYFQRPYPKSTGREYFNSQWLESNLKKFMHLNSQDIQATLLELTAMTITDSILEVVKSGELIICGGGARNTQLMTSIENKLANFKISISDSHGLTGDSVEAVAFAWLAKQAIEKKPINYTNITGASHPVIMGGIYFSES